MNEDKFFELAEMAVKILADIEKRLEEVEKRLEGVSKPKMGGGSPAYEPIPYWLQPGFQMPKPCSSVTPACFANKGCICPSKHIHLGAGDPQSGGYGN